MRLLALYVYDGRVGDCERARQGYQEYHLDPHTHTHTHRPTLPRDFIHVARLACLPLSARLSGVSTAVTKLFSLLANTAATQSNCTGPSCMFSLSLKSRVTCEAHLFAKYGCYCYACGQADADGATSLADHAVH